MMDENELRGKHARHADAGSADAEPAPAPADAEPAPAPADLSGFDVEPDADADPAQAQEPPAPEEGEQPPSSERGQQPQAPEPAAGAAPVPPAGAPTAAHAPSEGPADAGQERASDRSRRNAIAAACAAAACLVAAYLAGLFYYSSHFLPNTEVGSYDISGLTAEEAAGRLADVSGGYALAVTGGGLDFTVSSGEAGLQLDSDRAARAAMDENAAFSWPYYLAAGQRQDLTDSMQATFDRDALSKLVAAKVEEANADATEPVSAGISYDADSGSFSVVPEQLGTKLDGAAVLAKVEEAASRMEEAVAVGEDELLRPPLTSDDPRLEQAAQAAGDLLGADVDVMLGELHLAQIDSGLIASWIALDGDVKPFLDEGLLRGWTGALAEKTNTVGKQREYTTPRGEHVVVEGGSYGWQIDYEAFVAEVKADVDARSQAVLAVPCTSMAATIPDEHNVDFGTRYIDVNLTTQHAVFYDGGKVLWEADIVSGMPDEKHQTPYGVYCINLKESPSKLIGEMVTYTVESEDSKGKKTETVQSRPEYETTVQYWMPFVGNSIGFHDATWQPGFGGSLYASGYGSHGCVNLSYSSAEELYGIVTAGTPVITHA